MMRLATLSLVAITSVASAFVAGERIIVQKGVWACYNPEYFIESLNVLQNTHSVERAADVFRATKSCTRLPVTAEYTIEEPVGFFIVDSLHYGGRARFDILRINFNGGKDIYIAAMDRRTQST